ncbi:MAG: hypothetical protein H0W40_07445 [Methylibium sp.]|uniref:hypothetical protein n=1 Tax=Methylibium sp. TaxID=2067992 RepID=UPI0017A14513|nr:hypothetical protein [Methylibium sp.]MBA3597196.1 hypothetical protein [Methylibium sp.]
MPRLAIVSVHYYPHCCEASLRELSRLAALAPPAYCVLVNNNPLLQDRLLGLAGRHAFIDAVEQHNNSGHEFGAYQHGLNQVLSHGEFDWVLFLNDTVVTHQLFCSRHRKTLASYLTDPVSHEAPAAVGSLETLPRPYCIEGARSHRWITTNIFALNRQALEVLNGRVHHPEIDGLIRTVGDVDSFFADDLDDALKNHLKAWLFGALPGSSWREAAPLTASNAGHFADKARSILQEKYLSALLEEGRTGFMNLRRMDPFDRVRCRAEQIVFDIRKSLGQA